MNLVVSAGDKCRPWWLQSVFHFFLSLDMCVDTLGSFKQYITNFDCIEARHMQSHVKNMLYKQPDQYACMGTDYKDRN